LTTPLTSILFVLAAAFVGSFGSVFLKAGASNLELSVSGLLRNWRLAAGVLLFLVSSVFFVAGIREGELTILYPMVSLGYVWTMLWSRMFFGEPITRTKLCGVGLILLGVALLGAGKAS
jgi:multidrug transporter EmrE-like cation transporter